MVSAPAPLPRWTIVGLGNPGPAYACSRHNVGFEVVTRLARGQCDLRPLEPHLEGAEVTLAGQRALLLRPLTYMNRSGLALAPLAARGVMHASALLVIHDEVDLPLGRLRLGRGRGHGGHNGVRSILEALGTADFYRLRVGVGRPPSDIDLVHWVLSPFEAEELETLEATLDRAAAAAVALLEWGYAKAASVFNAPAGSGQD